MEKVKNHQEKQKKKKKSKESQFSKEKVLLGLNRIFREFHYELSTRLTKVTKEKRIFFLTEFGKLYYSIKENCENTYKSQIAKDNEFLIIPSFHNSLKKVFEKFTINLEKKFFEFLEKTKSSINMQENLDKNFFSVLEDQILHTKNLGNDLEKYFLKKREFDMIEKKDHVVNRKGFNETLRKVVENQQKINFKIQAISDKLSVLENKQVLKNQNLNFGRNISEFSFAKDNQNYFVNRNQQNFVNRNQQNYLVNNQIQAKFSSFGNIN